MFKKNFPVIVFEGIEASGKSTNILNFIKYLRGRNIKFIKIREPGGSKFSEKIRKLMLSTGNDLDVKTDLLLIMASRSENMKKILSKYYKKKVIIIDRFSDSTLAYQHYGMGISMRVIKQINSFVVGKFKPDLTFLCTVNKSNMIKRLNKRILKNRYDNFKHNFYQKIQNGFLKISKNKSKYVLLNSDKSTPSENFNKIINAYKKIKK